MDIPQDPQVMEPVLRNIRAAMVRSGVTQSQIAGLLGVSQVAVSKRMRGVVALSVPELLLLAEFLEVPATDLLEAVKGDR